MPLCCHAAWQSALTWNEGCCLAGILVGGVTWFVPLQPRAKSLDSGMSFVHCLRVEVYAEMNAWYASQFVSHLCLLCRMPPATLRVVSGCQKGAWKDVWPQNRCGSGGGREHLIFFPVLTWQIRFLMVIQMSAEWICRKPFGFQAWGGKRCRDVCS